MMAPTGSAPVFTVPVREIVALEHPMIVKNIDNGLKTLGSGVPLQQLLTADGYEGSFPLYLRTVDPTCAPLLSNNTPSSNVLLKVTLPKRTGRKRKRGSDEPYMLDPSLTPQVETEGSNEIGQSTSLRSHSRLDDPKYLLRSLKDNVGKYHIEPVGGIDQTHRYRGMTDFHYSTYHGKFMTKFRETILPGNVESLRKFKLDPSRGVKENDELIPPPTFSDKSIPVNWGYHQNPNIKLSTDKQTGETILTNQSRPMKIKTFYVPFDTPTVPTHPPTLPPPDAILESLLTELRVALSERPIWTRRAILNRIPRSNPGIYLLKPAIQYVAYQFRGGPWRDAIVRYGVDPRSSPEYRFYQTLFFKIVDHHPSQPLTSSSASLHQQQQQQQLTRQPWHDKRSEYTRKAHPDTLGPNSHIFDGTSISLDGKVWQVCDITDPLLARLLLTPVLREKCDLHSDGWFCNGTWAKVRAIMRTKISAIRIGREMLESDFRQTLLMPDHVADKARPTAWMPNLGLVANSIATDGDDGDGEDGGDGSEGDDWVHGTTGLIRAPGTSAKAWRRRKIRGIKKRNRKRLDGTSNMGFGRARSLATSSTKKGKAGNTSGPGSEAMGVSGSLDARDSVRGESTPFDTPSNAKASLAATHLDAFDGAAEGSDRNEGYRVEEEAGYDEGEEAQEGAEEDDGEEDEDGEEEDDEELDGEGW